MITAIAMLAGCNTVDIKAIRTARVLTLAEMDQVSAGSAVAVGHVDAFAVGFAPQTAATTTTLASADILVPAPPFLKLLTLNYASAQGAASAGNALLTTAGGSTHIGVDGVGGGAAIDAASASIAAGSSSSHAQINMQFYGLSIDRVDLVFGTATATACCAPTLRAQTTADGSGGGHWRELRAFSITDIRGVQSRVDISVVSSALPILDAGQVAALVSPTLLQSSHQ
jgi:hypothetical protein